MPNGLPEGHLRPACCRSGQQLISVERLKATLEVCREDLDHLLSFMLGHHSLGIACQAKDAVNLQKDGTLKTDSVAQRAAQGSLVIDLSNGEVRSDGEQESLKMTVRQHGNETVLVPSFAPEFVRNVIRIYQTEGQIVFSQYILDLLISGTCAPIQ